MTPRSIAEIKAQMVLEKSSQTTLAGLNSTSQVAFWNLLFYICAVAISLFEQILYVFQTDIETQIKSAPVGSDYWLQKKVLEFQYSATTPQVITLVNFAPQYATVNTALRIISRCSVKTSASKTVAVKVATGSPPAALSAPQKAALTTYLTNGGNGTTAGVGIGFAGVQINVISLTSDKVFIEGTIKYDGQYASVISTNVIAAINNYLANIEFDGLFKTLTLIDYIQAVAGVTDVNIVNLAIRADATVFGSKSYLIQSSTTLYTSYQLYAGYVVEETTAGQTFTDKLTFTANS